MSDIIESNPGILGGKPIIKGIHKDWIIKSGEKI